VQSVFHSDLKSINQTYPLVARLDIVLMDTPTEELPNYFFNLVDADQGHIANDIGYAPISNLSRYEKYALEALKIAKEEKSPHAISDIKDLLKKIRNSRPIM